MSRRLEMRASATRDVDVELDRVWRWLVALPGALEVFPMLSEYRDLGDGRYHLSLGRVGVGTWKRAVECVVRVDTSGRPVIRFDPVPGQGNTDAQIEMTLTPRGEGTRIGVRATVSPRMDVPALAPVDLIERTTGATLAAAVRRMLKGVERGAMQQPGLSVET